MRYLARLLPIVGLAAILSGVGNQGSVAVAESGSHSTLTAEAAAARDETLFRPLMAELPPPNGARATLGLDLPTTLFGADNRVQVTDTTRPGFRSMAYLVGASPTGESYTCSGSFLNSNVILTAAHCLWLNGRWAGSIFAIPAANGSRAPFGVAYASTLSIPTGYSQLAGNTPGKVDGQAIPFDFGLIFIKGKSFGTSLAPYLQLSTVADDYFPQADALIGTAGYPADKPAGTMWYAETASVAMDATLLYTLLDEVPGQSGSPIFTVDRYTGEPGSIVSIVTEATAPNNNSVRITDAVVAILRQYCANLGCSFTATSSPITGMAVPNAVVTGPISGSADGCLPVRAKAPSPDGAARIAVVCPEGDASLLINRVARSEIGAVPAWSRTVDVAVLPSGGPVRVLRTRMQRPGGGASARASLYSAAPI